MAKKKTSPPDITPDAVKPSTRRRAPARAAAPRETAANGAAVQARRDPTYDEIAEAAYRRYLSRGGGHGHDFDDWLEAERELRSRR